jgi:hypothetical protein
MLLLTAKLKVLIMRSCTRPEGETEMNVINNDKSGYNRILNYLFRFEKSNIPIVLAFILMLCSMIMITTSPRSISEVMNQESTTNYAYSSFANSLLSYAYILLFVGLIWKFAKYIMKKDKSLDWN